MLVADGRSEAVHPKELAKRARELRRELEGLTQFTHYRAVFEKLPDSSSLIRRAVPLWCNLPPRRMTVIIDSQILNAAPSGPREDSLGSQMGALHWKVRSGCTCYPSLLNVVVG